MDADLVDDLQIAAEVQKRTLNNLVVKILTEWIAQKRGVKQ